jgi:serine/threonine-protein kinase
MTHELRLGDTLGRYRLEGSLGAGAMGVVFRATTIDTGETVAVKVLRTELGQSDSYKRRLAREARVASDVRHPHLVSVFETGSIDDVHYVVMEYVDGASLTERLLSSEPVSVKEALAVGVDVASGLGALHERDIVHRDVKPSNVLLSGDRGAVLSDFGVAKGRAFTQLTRSGEVLGTVSYMAPEVIGGAAADARSDVYSLGCLIFECLGGEPPFGRGGGVRVGLAHLHDPPPDLRDWRPDLSPTLAATVSSALAKDPSERPSSPRAYVTMLGVAARRS